MNIDVATLSVSAAIPALMAVCLMLTSRRCGKMLTLGCLFLLGGLTSYVLTAVLNHVLLPLEELAAGAADSIRATLASAFITAALSEELSRFLTTVCIIRVFRHFVGDMSVLTCGMIGLGFALFENAFYAMTSANALEVVVQRTIPTMSHGATAVIMGFYLQRATSVDRRRSIESLILALLVPFVLHGLYDFVAFIVEITQIPDATGVPKLSDLGVPLATMLAGVSLLLVELIWASRIVLGVRRTSNPQESHSDSQSDAASA